MADIINKPGHELEDAGGSNQVYYYNRDGSNSRVVIIKEDYIFSNFPKGAGEITLDKTTYPFVKIDNQYYINDGEKWEYDDGRDSAALMSFTDAFLWDSKSLQSDKFIGSLITTDSVNYFKTEQFTGDEVDVYGDTISYANLNAIATYKTIPFYYINRNQNQSYKVISFERNEKDSWDTSQDNSGHYVFSEGGIYNTQYWGFKPQIYPKVVFNNMTILDSYWSTSNNKYVLNNHTIKKTSSQLIIDGVTYTLTPNDTVICYIRNQGEYLSNCKPTMSDLKIPADLCGETEMQIKDDLSITSTLSFSDIELYDFSDVTCDTSFSASTAYKSTFTTNSPTSEELYKKIIYKYPDWTMQMPTITGADFGSTRNFFASLGTYTFNRNWLQTVVDIQFQKNLTFSNNCTVKNFSSMVESSTVSNLWKSDDKSVDCYVYAPGSSVGAVTAKYANTMRFQVTSTSLVGTFPQNMGFFQSNYEEKNKGSTFVSWKVYLTTSGLTYSYKENYSSDNAAYTVDFKLTSGYINSLQTDTFAMAIVIWRNGKMLGSGSSSSGSSSSGSSSSGSSSSGSSSSGGSGGGSSWKDPITPTPDPGVTPLPIK